MVHPLLVTLAVEQWTWKTELFHIFFISTLTTKTILNTFLKKLFFLFVPVFSRYFVRKWLFFIVFIQYAGVSEITDVQNKIIQLTLYFAQNQTEEKLSFGSTVNLSFSFFIVSNFNSRHKIFGACSAFSYVRYPRCENFHVIASSVQQPFIYTSPLIILLYDISYTTCFAKWTIFSWVCFFKSAPGR